jgi:hypothetical protein
MIQSEARARFVDFSIIIRSLLRSLHESLLAVHRSAAGKGLGYAARAGHLRTVEAFIGSLGVDVEAVDRAGWAATMRAARNGQTDTVNIPRSGKKAWWCFIAGSRLNHSATLSIRRQRRDSNSRVFPQLLS